MMPSISVGRPGERKLASDPKPHRCDAKTGGITVQSGGTTRPLARRGERMHRNRTARRLMPWAIVLTLGMLATLNSRAQPPDKGDPKTAPPVKVDAKTGILIDRKSVV